MSAAFIARAVVLWESLVVSCWEAPTSLWGEWGFISRPVVPTLPPVFLSCLTLTGPAAAVETVRALPATLTHHSLTLSLLLNGKHVCLPRALYLAWILLMSLQPLSLGCVLVVMSWSGWEPLLTQLLATLAWPRPSRKYLTCFKNFPLQNQLLTDHQSKGLLWTLNSLPLLCMVFLGPEPQCLDHVDFAFSFKTTKHPASKTYSFSRWVWLFWVF